VEPEGPDAGQRPVDPEGDDRRSPPEAGHSGDAAPSPVPSSALPPRIESWRRRSAAGAILTGFAMGLKEALEPQRQEPSIVMETSGDPPRDLPVEAEVDQIRPSDNVVKIRPWLLDEEEDPPSP
jgi:hypothetical protein